MNQFWRASSMEYMSASEVALYAFIVNECNLHRWDMPVPCSTVQICEVLHMSKQTLCTARRILPDVDLSLLPMADHVMYRPNIHSLNGRMT